MIPLSFAQQRLWFIEQFEGVGALYNMPLPLRFESAPDVAALEAALRDVVVRHESLRTVFPESHGGPVQRVLDSDEVSVGLEVRECGDEAELRAAVRETAAHAFDLASDIPIRTWLLREPGGVCVLVLLLHHIAADGRSLGPLLGDLSTAYAARTRQAAPDWAPLPVQYADYAVWQRTVLGSAEDPTGELGRQLSHWRGVLEGLPEELALPYDRPRPAVPSRRGGSVHFDVDREVHAQLVRLAAECRVSLFMVVQAAVTVLYTRLGAGHDIPLGTPVAGRGEEALDDLVGFFVNTLVLRADTSGDPSFVELLKRVRAVDLEAYAHQEAPFESIVEHLNPTRLAARHPLVQTVVTLNTRASEPIRIGDLACRLEEVDLNVAKFDLLFGFTERRSADGDVQGISGLIEFAADLFEEQTVDTLARRLHRVLSAVAARPDLSLGAIDFLEPDEREHLLADGKGPASDPLTEQGVHRLFEDQVEARPDAVAVTTGEETLTYAELNTRANRLAHRLIARGIASEDTVAVLMDRGIRQVVATLAIAKLGATLVPLDGRSPLSRLETVIEDAQASLLLVDPTHRGHPVTGTGRCEAVDTDDIGDELAAFGGSDRNPVVAVHPDQLVHVMYTSGSSGTPKGVGITHRNVVDLLGNGRFWKGSHERVLLHSPSAFDASTTEFWGPLVTGGAIVVHPPDHLDVATFVSTVAALRPTVVQAPSGLFQLLVSEDPKSLRGVREVWTGGDVVPPAATRRLLRTCPQTDVVAVYGPTETTAMKTWHVMTDADEVPAVVPLGRPLDNATVLVLDEHLQPLPAGVTGELYIAGPGLARGYLGRPASTADRFVACPFGGPGARMYRTGDRARRKPDGVLEFAGRADDQVKLRGFRVEPGEIESVLAEHRAVSHAVVVVHTSASGDRHLVAYVTGAPRPDADELRAYAARHLPEYMVPSVVIPLDRMPLTANGKVDRTSLPDPEPSFAKGGRAPRTPTEEAMCRLFAETLALEKVSIDDDFFHLGGHSLLATRLVSRIRSALGIELSVRVLFQNANVAALTHHLTATESSRTALLIPLRSEGAHTPLFCVHPGAGIGRVYTALLDPLRAQQPVYALQAPVFGTGDSAVKSVEEMAAAYVDLVRAVLPTGPYRLLGWSFGGVVAHSMAVRLQNLGQQVTLLALLDGYPPLGDTREEIAPGDEVAQLLVSLGYSRSSVRNEASAKSGSAPVTDLGDGPLAGVEEESVRDLARTLAHHVALAGAHTPKVYRGDAVFFTARLSHEPEAAEAWRPYLSGELECLEVDCEHGDMMSTRHAAVIGDMLARRLREPGP
ncbi:non-ribosomal peptide synthetase [Streptomyces sp. NPDC004532]